MEDVGWKLNDKIESSLTKAFIFSMVLLAVKTANIDLSSGMLFGVPLKNINIVLFEGFITACGIYYSVSAFYYYKIRIALNAGDVATLCLNDQKISEMNLIQNVKDCLLYFKVLIISLSLLIGLGSLIISFMLVVVEIYQIITEFYNSLNVSHYW